MRKELQYYLDSTKFPIQKKGKVGPLVKLIQEWLCLHGYHIVIDGDFGPATEYAVKQFQKHKTVGLDSGVIDSMTFKELTSPIWVVLAQYKVHDNLTDAICFYADLHKGQHPMEIGGQNRGPWVRLYMNGFEGKQYPWCAGFVSYIVMQASKDVGCEMPFTYTWSAPDLIAQAKKYGTFLNGRKGEPKKGSIFCQKSRRGYSHTGIVLEPRKDAFISVEGNTNDEGSAEGYEVCSRIRSYANKDYVLL